MADELYDLLSPLLATAGLELFDVQVGSHTITVTLDRPGGVDLDALAEANRLVSAALDEKEPIAGSYTLEVSSPGLERRLRTPGHFQGAIGEEVTVRTLAGAGDHRRVRGRLSSVDDSGIVLAGPDVPGGELSIPFGAIERARTVFEWGSGPAPSPSSGAKGSKAKKKSGSAKQSGSASRDDSAGPDDSAGSRRDGSRGEGPAADVDRERVATQ